MTDQDKQGMSRRTFVKSSAAAGFAILSARSGVAETNSDTLTAGLIGCGGRGTGAAINFMKANENVKITALADLFEDHIHGPKEEGGDGALKKLESFGKGRDGRGKFDVQPDMIFTGWDAYKQLLATDVDIIIHATTPYIRPLHIEAAVEAGKHIFTEKPAATDPVGIRQFIAAAKKAEEKGLSLVAGTQRRHQKSYVDTIKQLQDGAIGDIVAARAYWCGTLPFVRDRKEGWNDLEYRIRNWYAYCWVCGDNIVEQHVHNLDVINWVMGGPPKKVFASGGRAWKPLEERYGDHYDHFSCDYEYPNGVHMQSMSRHYNNSDGGVFEWVKGTKGVSDCRNMGKDDANPYDQEHADLVASIRGTGPYLNEGVRVAESTMTAIMGRMSAYTGKELTWDEAMNSDLSLVPELDFNKPCPWSPPPVPGSKK